MVATAPREAADAERPRNTEAGGRLITSRSPSQGWGLEKMLRAGTRADNRQDQFQHILSRSFPRPGRAETERRSCHRGPRSHPERWEHILSVP